MTRRLAAGAAFLAVALHGAAASAGVYADDFGKCLVSASGSEGQATLMQWMFASLSLNPVVAPLSSVTPEQRDALNRKNADLIQKLVFTDCRQQAVAAMKNEGPAGMQLGFGVLGQVAMRGLVSDPSTTAGLAAYAKYLDQSKLKALSVEAGAAQAPAAPAAPGVPAAAAPRPAPIGQ